MCIHIYIYIYIYIYSSRYIYIYISVCIARIYTMALLKACTVSALVSGLRVRNPEISIFVVAHDEARQSDGFLALHLFVSDSTDRAVSSRAWSHVAVAIELSDVSRKLLEITWLRGREPLVRYRRLVGERIVTLILYLFIYLFRAIRLLAIRQIRSRVEICIFFHQLFHRPINDAM